MSATVRVRVAVVTNRDGEWVAHGEDGASDKQNRREALMGFDDDGSLRVSFIEADVPLPHPPAQQTFEASVSQEPSR